MKSGYVKLFIFLFLFLVIPAAMQAQIYSSEPHVVYVGWETNKYTPDSAGIKAAMTKAASLRVKYHTPIILDFAAGVYNLKGLGIILTDSVNINAPNCVFNSTCINGTFYDTAKASVTIFGYPVINNTHGTSYRIILNNLLSRAETFDRVVTNKEDGTTIIRNNDSTLSVSKNIYEGSKTYDVVIAASGSIKAYRADYFCPGIGDDALITHAKDSLKALPGKHTILCLPGTYNVVHKILVDTNIIMVGDGAIMRVQDNLNENVHDVFDFAGGDHGNTGITGFEVDGNGENNMGYPYPFTNFGHGVYTADRDEATGIIKGIAENVVIKDCYIHDTQRTGMVLCGINCNAYNCTIKNSYKDHLVYVSSGQHCNIYGVTLEGFAGDYVVFANASANDNLVVAHDNSIQNVTIKNVTKNQDTVASLAGLYPSHFFTFRDSISGCYARDVKINFENDPEASQVQIARFNQYYAGSNSVSCGIHELSYTGSMGSNPLFQFRHCTNAFVDGKITIKHIYSSTTPPVFQFLENVYNTDLSNLYVKIDTTFPTNLIETYYAGNSSGINLTNTVYDNKIGFVFFDNSGQNLKIDKVNINGLNYNSTLWNAANPDTNIIIGAVKNIVAYDSLPGLANTFMAINNYAGNGTALSNIEFYANDGIHSKPVKAGGLYGGKLNNTMPQLSIRVARAGFGDDTVVVTLNDDATTGYNGTATFNQYGTGPAQNIILSDLNTTSTTVLNCIYAKVSDGTNTQTAVEETYGKTSNTSGGDKRTYINGPGWSGLVLANEIKSDLSMTEYGSITSSAAGTGGISSFIAQSTSTANSTKLPGLLFSINNGSGQVTVSEILGGVGGNNTGSILRGYTSRVIGGVLQTATTAWEADSLQQFRFFGNVFPITANAYQLGLSTNPWFATYTNKLIVGGQYTTSIDSIKFNPNDTSLSISIGTRTFTFRNGYFIRSDFSYSWFILLGVLISILYSNRKIFFKGLFILALLSCLMTNIYAQDKDSTAIKDSLSISNRITELKQINTNTYMRFVQSLSNEQLQIFRQMDMQTGAIEELKRCLFIITEKKSGSK